MAKWQILKWSEKDIVKFLNIQKLRSFVGPLVMKTMKKNAREHKINKVIQELTAAGLHIDNKESLKKINKK